MSEFVDPSHNPHRNQNKASGKEQSSLLRRPLSHQDRLMLKAAGKSKMARERAIQRGLGEALPQGKRRVQQRGGTKDKKESNKQKLDAVEKKIPTADLGETVKIPSVVQVFNDRGARIGKYEVSAEGEKNSIIVVDDSLGVKLKAGDISIQDAMDRAIVKTTGTVLEETLHVLQRTEENGGTKEEASLVFDDHSILRQQQGNEGQIVGAGKYFNLIAGSSVPKLPEGKTDKDVAANIHSHLTKLYKQNNMVFQHSTEPSNGFGGDRTTFERFALNIIVGHLNRLKVENGKIVEAPLGAAFYQGGTASPFLKLTKEALVRINEERKK